MKIKPLILDYRGQQEAEEKARQERQTTVPLIRESTDLIFNNILIKIGWKDRLRILFGRPILIESKIYTKIPSKPLVSVNQVFVNPIFPLPKTHNGDFRLPEMRETTCHTNGHFGAKLFNQIDYK